MRILALITARGGSKRLPGKNLRFLDGRPLVLWSIEFARKFGGFCDILVSTDSKEIAEISRKAGACVPWLRPAALATDTATSVDVCIHALEWYEFSHGKIDGLVLLQPTSPFRSQETLIRGLELFEKSREAPVVAVTEVKSHPDSYFTISANGCLSMIRNDRTLPTFAQHWPKTYQITGSFYAVGCCFLRRERTFIGSDTIALIVDKKIETLDIDDEWDWKIAEFVCSSSFSTAR